MTRRLLPLGGGWTTSDFEGDNLVLSPEDAVSERITLEAVDAVSPRGLLIGRTRGSTTPTTGTADGDNTGNGTVTAVTGRHLVQTGTYLLTARTSGATARFVVTAPDGTDVGEAVTATAFTSDQLNLLLNDGANNFAVGDFFTIAVTGGAKWKESVRGAVDGSQLPRGILVRDVAASTTDTATAAFVGGRYNATDMTFGAGHSFASAAEALRVRGIILEEAAVAEKGPY